MDLYASNKEHSLTSHSIQKQTENGSKILIKYMRLPGEKKNKKIFKTLE